MDRYLENIEHKAAVLCDALPYIRDFVNKIIVVEYDCGEWLSGVEEKKLMKDIVLLKSIGVIPIVVHRTPMGVDKFRENKRIAKMLELCGTKDVYKRQRIIRMDKHIGKSISDQSNHR